MAFYKQRAAHKDALKALEKEWKGLTGATNDETYQWHFSFVKTQRRDAHNTANNIRRLVGREPRAFVQTSPRSTLGTVEAAGTYEWPAGIKTIALEIFQSKNLLGQ